MACPMPIVKTALAFKGAAAGEEFEVVCDDPGFEPDIKAWCSATGNTLEGITKDGKDLIAIIRKG